MLPSQYSEFQCYPVVQRFVSCHLDMQFNDVRAMLKLPLPRLGIDAGCNFAAAIILCNLISGVSVVLYTPKGATRGSGQKFKALLKNFYPWQANDEDKIESAKVIYDLVRNPLTHSLGIGQRGALRVLIAKDRLPESKITELERSSRRPIWCPPAVAGDATKYVLSVWGLYWGVFHLLGNLAGNTQQMQEAEKRLVTLARVGL